MSSSGRGGKRQGAPPPAPFGAAAKRAQPHGGHLADDSIRASGDLSSPIGSAPNGRCLLFQRNIKFMYAFVMLDEMVESAVHNLSARCHTMLQQRRKLIQFPSASGPWSLISYQFARCATLLRTASGQGQAAQDEWK
uniref:Uncharacterized protein n=1 Tax=Oryza meridionalis TaxID=40149 RepID=A0A0E0EPS6_9ORYZ